MSGPSRPTPLSTSGFTRVFKGYYRTPVTFKDFKSGDPKKSIGEMSSQRVDPTISYALIWQALMAVFFSLIIHLYLYCTQV